MSFALANHFGQQLRRFGVATVQGSGTSPPAERFPLKVHLNKPSTKATSEWQAAA